jgi:hypothetical protein
MLIFAISNKSSSLEKVALAVVTSGALYHLFSIQVFTSIVAQIYFQDDSGSGIQFPNATIDTSF